MQPTNNNINKLTFTNKSSIIPDMKKTKNSNTHASPKMIVTKIINLNQQFTSLQNNLTVESDIRQSEILKKGQKLLDKLYCWAIFFMDFYDAKSTLSSSIENNSSNSSFIKDNSLSSPSDFDQNYFMPKTPIDPSKYSKNTYSDSSKIFNLLIDSKK